jgi:putative ABC transport system substrate-binding protein
MLAVTGGMACDGAHSSRGSAAWPVVATARERVKRPRVGFLMHLAPGDPDAMARVAGFLQGLQELGWATDRNIHIDYRWAVGQAELYRKYAAELVALQPDVLVTAVTDSVRALQRATRTIPIVFTSVIDPVGSGLITSLSHPGGNATGFSLFEFGISGKWLELLKQIAPSVTQLRFLGIATRQGALDSLRLFKRMPLLSGWIYFRSMRMKAAISTVLSALSPGGRAAALLVTSSPTALINRDLIIKLTAQHHLPAIYPFRNFATGGGLTSYGPDLIDPCRRAASYVDRILKGEKPADLPVQAPTKFELVINLKTAKALGLDVPSSVLARADEVIE